MSYQANMHLTYGHPWMQEPGCTKGELNGEST
jgi:hypothetical protein